MNKIDYKKILYKYIEYISQVEGSDSIYPHDERYMCDIEFTKEEWVELEKISKELRELNEIYTQG